MTGKPGVAYSPATATIPRVQALGFVLDRWPELRPVFKTDPENGGWEWDEPTRRYLPAS
jgi:hypothetical protein